MYVTHTVPLVAVRAGVKASLRLRDTTAKGLPEIRSLEYYNWWHTASGLRVVA